MKSLRCCLLLRLWGFERSVSLDLQYFLDLLQTCSPLRCLFRRGARTPIPAPVRVALDMRLIISTICTGSDRARLVGKRPCCLPISTMASAEFVSSGIRIYQRPIRPIFPSWIRSGNCRSISFCNAYHKLRFASIIAFGGGDILHPIIEIFMDLHPA